MGNFTPTPSAPTPCKTSRLRPEAKHGLSLPGQRNRKPVVFLIGGTIRTVIITNENLEILFRFRFRNGKTNQFPQIFFRICFRNGHVGHAQATTTGHTYE